MSFDKDYPNRKDYRDTKHVSNSRGCRPHGSCDYCERNRLHNSKKRIQQAKDKEKE